MNRLFPITIGVGAGAGLVLTLAIWGADFMVWGLIGGAALGAVFGLITTPKTPK